MQKIIKIGMLLLMMSNVRATMTKSFSETSSNNDWERAPELLNYESSDYSDYDIDKEYTFWSCDTLGGKDERQLAPMERYEFDCILNNGGDIDEMIKVYGDMVEKYTDSTNGYSKGIERAN